MTLVQSEPKAIKIGIPKSDYSAMQGPCDTGFHIPLQSEWQTIYNIGVDLGIWSSSNGDGMKTYLKIPFSGQRNRLTSDAGQQGSNGYYWFSDNSSGSSKCMNIASLVIQITDNQYTGLGRTVRPIKDTPVTPDSSWTALYSDKIYHNSTLGLISISSDGTNWITIADKNVGATSTDTSSSDSYGYYFQRGNCYGFPTTGSVSTSSSTVNAGSYGPGNYYSSSTFVTVNGAWDNSNNYNLRGGETGAVLSADTDIKAVYLGTTKVRPTFKPKTFTISRTEQSNMSSGWTYSDDAAGLTAGDGAFDDFFGYSAVLLNTSGVETAEMKQSGGVFTGAMTTLGNITSGDNVMIKFPVRGIKMTKSSNVVTLSITEELGKSGYQYYAFQKTGNVNSNDETTATYDLYLGAYLGYNSSGVTKSRSGKTPSAGALSDFITGSSANGTGWTIMGWYQRCLINAYYMMKYGNPNSQSVVGKGYTGGSSFATTGGTNSQTNATYGTSSTTQQIKLFGLEDFWGNAWTFIGGVCTASSNQVYVALHDFASSYSTSSPYVYLFQNSFTTGRETKGIQGTNKGMFMPNSTVSNSSYNTYYCDGATTYQNGNCRHGGDYSQGEQAGIFRIGFYEGTGTTQGARLMYL